MTMPDTPSPAPTVADPMACPVCGEALSRHRDGLRVTIFDFGDSNQDVTAISRCVPDEPSAAPDTDQRIADLIRERDALRAELAKRNQSASDRLHNLCRGIEQEADGSAFSREEWDRIDAENVALRRERDEARADAERYRKVRCGQRWSVIDWKGDELRAETLDASIDAILAGGEAA